MTLQKLSLACPQCASRAVFYSCTPNCCFNHVCSDCGAAFEPATRALGGVLRGVGRPPAGDASDPTVACARCESIAVGALEDGRLVCCDCGTLLELA